jgi:hypothetical protein
LIRFVRSPFNVDAPPLLTCRDSKSHSLLPSLLVVDHQRSPTSSRPVTFFVTQKSTASSRTEMTKLMMKDLVIKVQMMKKPRAAPCGGERWKEGREGGG